MESPTPELYYVEPYEQLLSPIKTKESSSPTNLLHPLLTQPNQVVSPPQDQSSSDFVEYIGFGKSDIRENDSIYELRMDLPGIQLNDILIKPYKHSLTIECSRTKPHDDFKYNYVLDERFTGRFTREVHISFEIKQNRMDTSYRNGILTILIRKK